MLGIQAIVFRYHFNGYIKQFLKGNLEFNIQMLITKPKILYIEYSLVAQHDGD